MKKYIGITVLLLAFVACSSSKKLLEKGEDEKALQVSMKNLKHGKASNDELSVFEQAFYILNEKDKAYIKDWKTKGRPELWPKIYDKAKAIADRQEAADELRLSLNGRGHYPNLTFFVVGTILTEAAEKSAQYFYAQATEYFIPAREGDRPAARNAHDELDRALSYVDDFKDAVDLRTEMRELGTVHIYLTYDYRWIGVVVASNLFDALFDNQRFPYREGWQVIHTDENTIETRADYKFSLLFDNVDVSDDLIRETVCVSEKEVEDGFTEREEWSERDSAFVIVRDPVYRIITATVTTFEQLKSAGLDVSFESKDMMSGVIVNRDRVSADAFWDNIFSQVTGDRNALVNSDCEETSGSKRFYPSDGELLLDAVVGVRNSVLEGLDRLE